MHRGIFGKLADQLRDLSSLLLVEDVELVEVEVLRECQKRRLHPFLDADAWLQEFHDSNTPGSNLLREAQSIGQGIELGIDPLV